MYDITERTLAVLATLDEEYWDRLVKLRDDMLNDYKHAMREDYLEEIDDA